MWLNESGRLFLRIRYKNKVKLCKGPVKETTILTKRKMFKFA